MVTCYYLEVSRLKLETTQERKLLYYIINIILMWVLPFVLGGLRWCGNDELNEGNKSMKRIDERKFVFSSCRLILIC